jgi:hypothetical protein
MGGVALLEGISWRVFRFIRTGNTVRLTAAKGRLVAADVTLPERAQGESDEQWIARVELELAAHAYDAFED